MQRPVENISALGAAVLSPHDAPGALFRSEEPPYYVYIRPVLHLRPNDERKLSRQSRFIEVKALLLQLVRCLGPMVPHVTDVGELINPYAAAKAIRLELQEV